METEPIVPTTTFSNNYTQNLQHSNISTQAQMPTISIPSNTGISSTIQTNTLRSPVSIESLSMAAAPLSPSGNVQAGFSSPRHAGLLAAAIHASASSSQLSQHDGMNDKSSGMVDNQMNDSNGPGNDEPSPTTLTPASIRLQTASGSNTARSTSSSASVGLREFSLLKVVGKGSFGKVMQVRKKDNGRIYAMKVLQKANIIKRNQVEHTRTERNVLGRIVHPFIVSLSYAFQTEDKLYFVLDYCAGGELFFHLGREGRFSEDRARFYAAQIVSALEHLHSLNVIYRDLK
jgi:serum/glucocorticoid-regulated kinase 2